MNMSSQSAKGPTVVTLAQFLYPFRVEKGVEHTHTSLGKPLGSYYIPSSSHSAFLKVYKAAIERGEDVFLTERHRHIGPVVVDLDFRFEPLAEEQSAFESTAESVVLKRRHSSVIEGIVDAYCKAIGDLVETPESFDVYVTEKRSPSVWKKLVKDGLHIVAPSIVTRPALQLLLRKDVLSSLAEVFKPLNLCNKVEDVVDEAVIDRNNWMMYGSKKPGGEPYSVTRHYRYSYGKETPLILVGAGEELPSADYIELLSIRNKFDELRVREAHRDRAESFIAKIEEDRKRREAVKSFVNDSSVVSKSNTNTCSENDFDQVRKMVELLDPSRVETYEGWMRLGWCLRNIDHRLLESWVEVSKKSPKYVEGECPRVWNTMRAGGGLGLGTLHMWVKQDAPDLYHKLLRTDLVGLIKGCMSGAHYDVACVVHHLYRHEFVCCSIKPSQRWYEFREHRWHECDGGHSLRRYLSTYVYKEICAVAEQIVRRMGNLFEDDSNQSEERKMLNDQHKKLCDMALKLKTSKYKDDVMKECAELFYVERFENRLDANVELLGFDNGVYDLERMEFREGRPDDYVSFSTKINYVPYAGNDHPVIQEIVRYWENVHPNKDVRDYILKSISSCLSGRIREERFNIWTGSGCHAAGTKIMMIDGSTKNVEDVVIGDVLMGDDGTPRNVLALHRGVSDMWKITPIEGESFVVNGEHTLSFKMRQTVYLRRCGDVWDLCYHLYDFHRVIRGNMKTYRSYDNAVRMQDLLLGEEGGAVRSDDVVNVSVRNFVEKVKACDRRLFNLYRPDFAPIERQRVGIRSIKRVGDGNYYGFEVDSNHLFLMGDHIVTSNSNSKSMCVELIEKTLGQYCCKFPVTLLTQKRAVSNAATPEIARAKGRRFAVLQEPSEDERLNVGLMKELSGGDTVQTRELFKGPVEWKPQFKLFLLCNNLPNVPSDDGGTWRRIRVVEFASKFCENPNPEKPNEFLMDPDLKQKFDGWREHFMAILLKYYGDYVTAKKLAEPDGVMQCTREYQKTNDHMADFVDNCIEKVDGEALLLDDVFFEFKEWVKTDQVPIKVPKKGVLQKYLDRALNCKASSVKGRAVYRGFKMRDGAAEAADEL